MRYALLAAALFAPAPALAATGDIGCIEATLGPAAMQRIGDGVVLAADNNSDPARALDTDRDPLIDARQKCRNAGNWSVEATRIAMSYTQARATRIGAESALRRDDVDASGLAASYAALPIGDRRSLIAKPSPRAVAATRAASPRETARRHAYLYFAALAALEFYPLDFAAA